MSVGHYENFPVASVLLPKRLRQPVAVARRDRRGEPGVEAELVAAERARAAGLDVVMDDCTMRRHRRLLAAQRTPKADAE